MSSQGSISRELYQTSLVDCTLAVYKPTTAQGSYITPTPGYSTSFLFVRTPVGVEVKLPPLTGVVTNDTLPTPAAAVIHYIGIIPYAFRPVVTLVMSAVATVAASNATVFVVYNANGDLTISSTVAGTGTFAAAAAFALGPISQSYSSSSILEITQ